MRKLVGCRKVSCAKAIDVLFYTFTPWSWGGTKGYSGLTFKFTLNTAIIVSLSTGFETTVSGIDF